MSVQGGRRFLRLTLAVAIAGLLLPLLPVAPAQSISDPWWGPSDISHPTTGWAVRVPVTVENKFDYTLTDPYVGAEIDLTQLLVDAGWTNQTVGAETRLRGFTLDVDSIRVVPYNNGFVTGPLNGPDTKAIPHVLIPALLEAPKFRDFSPDRNPAATVLWQIDGPLRAHEKRSFYVYANPLEYGKTPPPVFQALDKGPLDALMWGSRGNVYVDWQPQQDAQNRQTEVFASSPGVTTVTVYTYQLGKFAPLASTSTFPNPFTLTSQGQSRTFRLPSGTPYKIEASKPVVVLDTGVGVTASGQPNWEPTGYLPGRSGSFADREFDIKAVAMQGPAGQRVMPVTLVRSSDGAVDITITSASGASTQAHLDAATPVKLVKVPVGGVPSTWASLTSTNGKFMVMLDAGGEQPGHPAAFTAYQVPAISGGAEGTDFFSHLRSDAGYYHLCPAGNATLHVLDTTSGTVQIYPDAAVTTNTPGQHLTKGDMCTDVAVQRSANPDDMFEAYSTPEASGTTTPFRYFVGAGKRLQTDPPNQPSDNLTRPMIGDYGGASGLDYYTYGQTGLFGQYNNTRLTIFEERLSNGVPFVVNRTRAIQRDEFLSLIPSADGTGRFHIVATKPISATTLDPAQYTTYDLTTGEPQQNPIGYMRYVPGRPLMPNITIGAAEFRGPLVELKSPETEARQIFRSTGPGNPVSFRVDVENLGRWINGQSLPDTIDITCTTPEGWTVDGCAKEFTMASGSAQRLNIVVTPSIDDVNQTRTINVEARSKSGGIAATFKLIVFVEVRYGVGMWFDVEGGRKTIDPPIGLDPGQSTTYQIVVKNTGSTTDTFTLTPEDPRDGWEQQLTLDGQPITQVKLDGGESTTVQFRVKAPNTETAPQNIVSITAQSLSSALAGDVVNTATRIRPKVDLEMTLDPQTRLAQPNETVVFNLTTRNKGNDVFTVDFTQDSILPKGWNATLSVNEITLDPNPSNDPNLSYVLKVAVTPPEGARAGDLASVKIAAEIDTGGAGGRVAGDEVSAVVVVRRVYNLTSPPVLDAEATPGETLHYVLPITNAGNGPVGVELLSGAATPAWPISLEATDVTLGVNDTADLPLKIDVPEGTPPGSYNFTFTTRLSREALENLTLPITVDPISRLAFQGATDLALTPGRPVSLVYHAKNTGNLETTFDLSADAPASWNATFSPARAHLAPGASLDALLTINASHDAADGPVAVSLLARADGSPASSAPLHVRVARPQLSLASVTGSGALRTGELVLVSANVVNSGGIEAQNVSVALTVDGRVVDTTVLSRIPVNSSALATLSWTSTQRGGSAKVVLDPDQEIALASRDSTAASVNFGSKVGVPSVAPMLIVTLFAAIAVVLRRGDRR